MSLGRMRMVLAIVLVLGLAIFTWSFVGSFTPVAQWSRIRYSLRALNVSNVTVAEIRHVLDRTRGQWLVARCLAGGIVVVASTGLLLSFKTRGDTGRIAQ
jgi:hypothetical protein